MLKTEVKFVIRCSGHPYMPVKQGLGVTRTAPCRCSPVRCALPPAWHADGEVRLVLLLAQGGQDPLLTSAYIKQLLDLQSEETPLLCIALLSRSDQQGRLLADFFVLISSLGSPGHSTEHTLCTCSALSSSCPLQTVH